MNSIKYPYTPKQLHILSKKCTILLLNIFTKIYQARDQYSLVVKSLSYNINTYKLSSLEYKITDRHFSRGFVTSRRPNTAILCNYIYCDSNSHDGNILVYDHGYHNICLQKSQFKYLICLDYL